MLLIVLAGIFAPSEEQGDEGAEQVIAADAEPLEEPDEAADGAEPEATEPPSVTAEPQPTSTPQPTPTPEATATPEPTPTPEPPGFGSGVQIVGSDIAPSIYATGQVGFCYRERPAGLSGELDDIIANDNAIDAAQVLVEVAAGDVALNSDGCGRWELVDAIELPGRAAPADGDWLVGRQIEPGIYRTVGEPEFCYSQQSSGLSGELADIISNDNVLEGRATVEIQPGDFAFTSSGCGDSERS